MKLWFDANLSPGIAAWTAVSFGLETASLRSLGLRDAADIDIFRAARDANAVIVTKDSDFAQLLETQGGPPPFVLWLTFGNTSNVALQSKFSAGLPAALDAFAAGAPLVEMV